MNGYISSRGEGVATHYIITHVAPRLSSTSAIPFCSCSERRMEVVGERMGAGAAKAVYDSTETYQDCGMIDTWQCAVPNR